jgi:hypothetical protein
MAGACLVISLRSMVLFGLYDEALLLVYYRSRKEAFPHSLGRASGHERHSS